MPQSGDDEKVEKINHFAQYADEANKALEAMLDREHKLERGEPWPAIYNYQPPYYSNIVDNPVNYDLFRNEGWLGKHRTAEVSYHPIGGAGSLSFINGQVGAVNVSRKEYAAFIVQRAVLTIRITLLTIVQKLSKICAWLTTALRR